MDLEPCVYSALGFVSENVWNHLITRGWEDIGSKDFHISLLKQFLDSALRGSFQGIDGREAGTFDSYLEEDSENYQILRDAFPDLGDAVRERIPGYVSSLETLQRKTDLDPREQRELFRLCINLDIASSARVPVAISLVA